MVLDEILEEIKKKKLQRIIFKVDIEKAYDTIEWGFLEKMTTKMNSSTKWRIWIKECISTTSFLVLVNGCPTKDFKLEEESNKATLSLHSNF